MYRPGIIYDAATLLKAAAPRLPPISHDVIVAADGVAAVARRVAEAMSHTGQGWTWDAVAGCWTPWIAVQAQPSGVSACMQSQFGSGI